MLLYWKVWTHPLSLCSLPVHSLPVAQWQLRTKNTTLLFSLYIFFPFRFFPFAPILFLVKLGLVKAQSTYFWNKQRHSESLQVSRESCQVWGFSVFPFFCFFFLAREKGCKLTCRGVRLCWLQETDALQEFWKQTRLTLFSRLWLLFSPLFWRCKQAPFKSSCIFIIISRELPGIPPIGKHVILSKAKVPIVWGEKCYFNYSKFSSTIPCKHAL